MEEQGKGEMRSKGKRAGGAEGRRKVGGARVGEHRRQRGHCDKESD